MQEKLSFEELSEGVLEQLKSQGYKDSTLTKYRKTFNKIFRFMESVDTLKYSGQIGKDFLANSNVCKSTLVSYRCAVRRLDAFLDGIPYSCHVSSGDIYVPEMFKDVLNGFLDTCKASGNKPLTIKAKKRSCALFLQFLENNGCVDLKGLNVELVSRGLAIYGNKDDYARLRLFLKHLFYDGITATDLSTIVPRHRRRKPIPTTYTPKEVLRIESSINADSDTGRRNLAIVRLASRMGYRAGDIAGLKWSNIDFSTGYISIFQEKTGMPLSLQMPQDVMDALAAYSENHPDNVKDDYVFHQMVAPYDRISTSIVRHAVQDAIVSSGVDYSGKKHGPHALRSSLASSMVNDRASYETVRKILGHTDPDVIKRYAKADIENLRRCSIAPPPPKGFFEDFLNGKKVV